MSVNTPCHNKKTLPDTKSLLLLQYLGSYLAKTLNLNLNTPIVPIIYKKFKGEAREIQYMMPP